MVASIHRLVSSQAFLDKMQIVPKEHTAATVRYFDVIIKTVAFAKNIAGPDPDELQKSIDRFQSFMARDRRE